MSGLPALPFFHKKLTANTNVIAARLILIVKSRVIYSGSFLSIVVGIKYKIPLSLEHFVQLSKFRVPTRKPGSQYTRPLLETEDGKPCIDECFLFKSFHVVIVSKTWTTK